MQIIILLLILLNMAYQGNCSNQISVVKYKDGKNCPSALVGVPIISTSSILEEFTFCGKFYFRFLRRSVLMSIEPDIILKIWDFEDKNGDVLYQRENYQFYFTNQTVTPDSWQYICLAISAIQTKIVWNGEILSINPKVDVSKEKIKAKKIWLGGALFHDHLKYHTFE